MHFITVRNLTGPSIRDLEVEYEHNHAHGSKVDLHDGPFLMIFSASADHLTLYWEDISVSRFRDLQQDENRDEFRIRLGGIDDGKLASRRTILHQGERGITFALLWTMKGSRRLTVPSYHTLDDLDALHLYDCALHGRRYLPVEPCRTFSVVAENWESVNVSPIRDES